MADMVDKVQGYRLASSTRAELPDQYAARAFSPAMLRPSTGIIPPIKKASRWLKESQ